MRPKFSNSKRLKNQATTASRNAKKAVNAIKFDVIPPIGFTMFEAPTEIASKKLFASLKLFY